MKKDIMIVKKNGNLEKFDPDKVKNAIISSAERVMVDLTEEALDTVVSKVLDLLKQSPIYACFKVLIFAPIAEEILFRESISSCVKNNVLFILLSAIIYTGMNFVFSSEALTFLDLLIYFLPAVLFSFLYVKNDRNIIIIMMIKFIMQFVPFIVLLLS